MNTIRGAMWVAYFCGLFTGIAAWGIYALVRSRLAVTPAPAKDDT